MVVHVADGQRGGVGARHLPAGRVAREDPVNPGAVLVHGYGMRPGAQIPDVPGLHPSEHGVVCTVRLEIQHETVIRGEGGPGTDTKDRRGLATHEPDLHLRHRYVRHHDVGQQTLRPAE